MYNIDWSTVSEATDEQLAPGGYICRICSVTDCPEKEYLRIELDISRGAFTGGFRRRFESFGNWPSSGVLIRSYKPSAQGFFKGFITALEKSNPSFRWTSQTNQNPAQITGLELGVIFGEEEYIGRDSTVKVSLKPRKTCSIQTIEDGSFKIPERKRLNGGYHAQAPAPGGYAALDEDDGELPF